MIIKGQQVLLTTVDVKQPKDAGKEPYCAITLVTIDDGQIFSVLIRDEKIYKTLKSMDKAICDFSLTHTDKYGYRLSVLSIMPGESIKAGVKS